MMKTYVGHGIDNHFAIKLESDAQHSMRARVLRPYIQEEEIKAIMFLLHAPLFRMELQRLLFGIFLFIWQGERSHLCCACRMILA